MTACLDGCYRQGTPLAYPTMEDTVTDRLTEGWAYPTNAATAPHYFRENRSLCGRYAYTGLGQAPLESDTAPQPSDCKACRRKLAADDPNDPTGWPASQQAVLRWVVAEGGWSTDWEGAPKGPARVAVEKRLQLEFQREHQLQDSPWYSPHTAADAQALRRLAAMLPEQVGPWTR